MAAGDALDSTFSARFERMMSEAGAAVRGFGSDLGPAVTGLASLASLGGAIGLDRVLAKGFGKVAGSAMVKGAASKAGAAVGLVFTTAMFAADKIGAVLAGALNKVPGSGAVKGAASNVGKFLGTTLGKFAAVGIAGVLLVEVVNTYNQVKAQIAEQNAEISGNVAKQVATGTTASLETSKAALEKGLQDINGVWDAGLFTTDSRKKLEADLAAVNARDWGAAPRRCPAPWAMPSPMAHRPWRLAPRPWWTPSRARSPMPWGPRRSRPPTTPRTASGQPSRPRSARVCWPCRARWIPPWPR